MLRTQQPIVDNLRPWRPTDAPAVLEAFSNPEIQHWHALQLTTAGEAQAWLAQWQTRWSQAEAASWAITRGYDEEAIGGGPVPESLAQASGLRRDVVVGQVGLRGIDLEHGTAHLSYWVLPGARGLGLAARAVATVERWCFERGFERLTLEHSTRNHASCRVAEKAGYLLEGTLRSAWQLADGRHDVHLHAQIRA